MTLGNIIAERIRERARICDADCLWLSLCGLAFLGVLLHGVAARIRLGTILTSPSNFQVTANYVPPDGTSLHVVIATFPVAHNVFLVVSLHTMNVRKMHAKFAPLIPNEMTTPFIIFNPCAFMKGSWSKDDQRL
jgi:hypothetical protein